MEYAKYDKSLLNYCHMSQMEPRITQLPYKKAPGLRGVNFFAVQGYLRSQANLVPHGVHFLQYRVVYILKRTSYLSGADYVMLCIVHEKMMQCV